MDLSDTIVARATPLGTGGVAIVRLSGTDAVQIVERFCRLERDRSLSELPARYMTMATISQGDQVLDHCLVVRFISPHSYTAEDVIELHLHGSPLIADQVIELALLFGARFAQPGEFTRRAFMNGKLDLTQVEALADILASESEQALFLSQRQLHGDFRREIESFRQKIIDLLALLELELDFAEDGYSFTSPVELQVLFDELESFARNLLTGYEAALRLRRGPRILLLGRPNAGKSSLFNALLGYSRALVSPIPGTTRDYLEERIAFNGVNFHIVDTAGLRQSSDILESSGIERARELSAFCDHILYLTDLTASSSDEDESEIVQIRSQLPSLSITRVFTKKDLIASSEVPGIPISILDTESIRALLEHLLAHFSVDTSERLALLNTRQAQLCSTIVSQLETARSAVRFSTEIISAELRILLRPLSELTGAIVNDDVLNHVFSSFCIGK